MTRRKPVRRRAAYQVINGQKHKLCTGLLHRDGQWVATPDGWFFRTFKGRRIERSECRECETHRRGCQPMVPYIRVRFAVTELVNRLGVAEASRQIGVTQQVMWGWRNRNARHIHRRTAVKIFLALREVRAQNLVRHRDSIRHGAKARGRSEKVPRTKGDFYKRQGAGETEVR